MLTCSRQFKRGQFYATIVFLRGLSLFSNNGGSHWQRFVTTFWTPWKAIKGKSIMFLSFIFLYQTNNKKWRYWCHLNAFFWDHSENEPACVVGVWTAVPKMGRWVQEGSFFFIHYYRRDLLILFSIIFNVHQFLSMLADDTDFISSCVCVCVCVHA